MLKPCFVCLFVTIGSMAFVLVAIISSVTGKEKSDVAKSTIDTLGQRLFHSQSIDPFQPYSREHATHNRTKHGKTQSRNVWSTSKTLVSIPESATQVSDSVYYLGKSKASPSKRDDGGFTEEKDKDTYYHGYAIIHSHDESAKPKHVGAKVEVTDNSTLLNCFSMLSDGAIWKNVEQWHIDTSNSNGLSDSFVRETWSRALSSWIDACPDLLIGTEASPSSVDGIDLTAPDGKNEVMFGNIDPDSTVGLTVVWGVFGGPVEERRLFEFDMIFNDEDYDLGNALSNSGLMDLQALMTHELGHRHGIADIYYSYCSDVVMYGRTSKGSVKQRVIDSLTKNSICAEYNGETFGTTLPLSDALSTTGTNNSHYSRPNVAILLFIVAVTMLLIQ